MGREDENKLARGLAIVFCVREIPHGFKQRLGRVAKDERESENDSCKGY